MKIKSSKRLIFVLVMGSFLIFVLCLLLLKLFIYKPNFNLRILKSYESKYLNFTENRKYIFMEPKNSRNLDKGIIFYPGGLVDENSYLPLLVELSKDGYGVYILKSPLKLSILNYNGAEKIIMEDRFDEYILMGHSLGGTSLLKYISKQTELSSKVNNVILLASYSDGNYIFDSNRNDNYKSNINMLSIVGTNDKIINFQKYEDDKINLSDSTSYSLIDGGNHSYFGNYGEQYKDYDATISIEEQQFSVLNEIKNFLNES